MSSLKPTAPKGVAALLMLIADIYLNTTVWNGWPTGSRGFPFAHETWCDAVPCFEFYWLAIAGNVAVALAALLILAYCWPARKISASEKVFLPAFLLTYIVANIQPWFGWRYTLWSIPWIPEGGETLVYGFPFVYRTAVEEHPLRLFANVLGATTCLVCIRAVSNKRTLGEAA
jgi:hypothetical protein